MNQPILKRFGPSDSPIIEAFGTPYADTKFQGQPIHRGLYIHGGRKNWRFSTEMGDISETVREDDGDYGTLIESRGCRI